MEFILHYLTIIYCQPSKQSYCSGTVAISIHTIFTFIY